MPKTICKIHYSIQELPPVGCPDASWIGGIEVFKDLSPMERVAVSVATLGSLTGIVLWVILVYFNPYSNGANTPVVFFRVLVPVVIGLVFSILRKPLLVFIVFLWFLPVSLYLAGTPGIFKYFGLVEASYFVAAVFLFIGKVKKGPAH